MEVEDVEDAAEPDILFTKRQQSDKIISELDLQRQELHRNIQVWLKRLEDTQQKQFDIQQRLIKDWNSTCADKDHKYQPLSTSDEDLRAPPRRSFTSKAADEESRTFPKRSSISKMGLSVQYAQEPNVSPPSMVVANNCWTGVAPSEPAAKKKLVKDQKSESRKSIDKIKSAETLKSRSVSGERRQGWQMSDVTSQKKAPLVWRTLSTRLGSKFGMVTDRGESEKYVHSPQFQLVVSVVVLLNAVFVGASADNELDDAIKGRDAEPVWRYIEVIFCALFSIELLARLLAERIRFVLGPEAPWNLFDFLLVSLSIFELAISSSQSSSDGVSSITVARILRIVRFMKVFRLARAARAFHSFRVVLIAVFFSLVQLFWCLLVVGFFIYGFALLFLQSVTQHFAEETVDDELRHELVQRYGSVYKAGVTLFMSISGGVDWGEAMQPLVSISWYNELAFVFFIFFMYLGVLNVVIGSFVSTTAEISSKDLDSCARNEVSKLNVYAMKIKAFFSEADADGNGMLSWDEFKEHLTNNKVKAYFQALELDISRAHQLFTLLDKDGSKCVSVDEFLEGCMKLKGEARSFDVNMILYENERLYQRLTEFMLFTEEAFKDLGASIDSRRFQADPIPIDNLFDAFTE